MTISSETARVQYAGDGSTASFSVPFYFLATDEVRVVHADSAGTETTWTEGTQYTLTGAGVASGGTLTVDTSPTDYTPASGETLTILRNIDLVQETDYPEGGQFPASAHEQALDRLYMALQQVSEQIGRTLLLPTSSSLSDLELPSPSASKLIGWNSGATGLQNYAAADVDLTLVSSFVQTLLDDTTAGAFLTTLGVSAFAQTILDDANAAAARSTLGAQASATALTQGLTTIWVPATAMVSRTTNGAASGSAESTTNKVMTKSLDFDTTTQEFAQFAVRFPKNWNEGTVTFAPIWSAASGTGGVVFGLAGVALSNDDAIDTAYGTAQTSTDTLIATGDIHVGPTSSAITIAGTPAAGDWVSFQVNRTVSDGSDTLNADARLLGIALFFTTDAGDDT